MDCLDAFIVAFKKNCPAVVFFDAECWDFHLVASYYYTYIILHKDKAEVFVINKTIREIARELISDIEYYLDDWVHWECYKDDNEEELEQRRIALEVKLTKLKILLDD